MLMENRFKAGFGNRPSFCKTYGTLWLRSGYNGVRRLCEGDDGVSGDSILADTLIL